MLAFCISCESPSAVHAQFYEVPISNNAYMANALNTSNPTSSILFTDTDGSQWICFADNGLTLEIAHYVLGTGTTVTNPGLAVWSTNDQHNACTIAVDLNGSIWVCYDQHVSPMNCYKSNAARNPAAFTKISPLVNSTNENSVTFPLLFTNPTTHALYLIYLQGTGFGSERGFFYCYNAGTTTWSGCPGTSTNGQMFSNSFPSTWISGLPQWDKTTGRLWFNWQWQDGTAPNWNCGDATSWPCAEWLVGWTGNGFVDIHGTTVTLPMTPTNPNPVVSIHSGIAPSFSILDSFSIDANEVAWMPFIDVDGSGFLQVYVTSANLSTGTAGSIVQLTSNASVFNPPAYAGWLGPSQGAGGNCNNAPYSCGENVQSVTAISSGTCTYVSYADIFNWYAGQAAFKSCNNFSSSTFLYLTRKFNPNIIIYPDQVHNFNDGTIAFMFMDSNDGQFRFSSAFVGGAPGVSQLTMIVIPTNTPNITNAVFSGSWSMTN